MGYFASIGLGSTLLPGVLWAKAANGEEINAAAIACAEEIAGLKFDDAEREMMLDGLKSQEARLEALHKIPLPNSVTPAIIFNPRPAKAITAAHSRGKMTRSRVPLRSRPANLEDLAFEPVTVLSEMIRRRVITPTELTKMYLARIKRYDPQLLAVITLTEDRALAQARVLDAEIARGKYRGPLHGIPWGAKDLLAVKGYKTTWGAGPYKDQVIDEDATVVQRLDAAGAILVAKLTLGELARGHLVWRYDKKSMEDGPGLERFISRPRCNHFRGTGWIRDR
jgi:hypothetical protein